MISEQFGREFQDPHEDLEIARIDVWLWPERDDL